MQQPNVFRFQESVPAHTVVKTEDVNGRSIPPRQEVRILGYCSTNALYATTTLPGSSRVWELYLDAGSYKPSDKKLLKGQLRGVVHMMAERQARQRVRVLAKSLGN
jgi:hypothetical protein